jgi:hypothetical protein
MKILVFYRESQGGEEKSLKVETERGRKASAGLRVLGAISGRMVTGWMEGWGL